MKELLAVVSLLLSGVAAEPPAPYAPSGWRPDGPSFELPARVPAQNPQKQEYLPPVDPRRPATPPEFDSGVDVSVQGLPVREQPIFQLSPISGQQYAGPNYQADIRSLDQKLQQIQYLQQLQTQQEFARQRQFEAARGNAPTNGLPNPQPPRRFVPQTTSTTTTTTTQKPELRTESSTEPFDLNEGEDYDDGKETDSSAQKQRVSVEVTKQNIQEYPPEVFLAPLSQFKIQPQFIQLQQLGQLKAPLYFQPIQQDTQRSEGFNGPAHFAALPSVLAQQQLLSPKPQIAPQPQPAFSQNPEFLIARGQEAPTPAYLVPAQEPLNQYQPGVSTQYQPIQPQVQAFPQFQAQPVILPPQTTNQLQPNQYTPNQQSDTEAIEDSEQVQPQQPQPQFVYQPTYQPQEVFQQQYPQQYPVQPQLNQYQPQEQQVYAPQPQLINYPAQDWNQYYQNQLYQQQYADPNQAQNQNFQGQDALQSGLDVDQGNGIDKKEESEDEPEERDGSQATAVATAFGARTQPRVLPQYGAPAAPRPQANPSWSSAPTTTDAPQEEEADDGPAIAQATAVATGSRKSAKLRSRRVRPVFTLDRSGHLVLAQEQ